MERASDDVDKKKRKKHKKRSRSSSEESSSSDSYSSSSSSDRRKERRKVITASIPLFNGSSHLPLQHKRRRSDRDEDKRSKKKHKKKHKKHKKKHKKHKKAKQGGAIDQSLYGSRGIKRREDFYEMRDEFEAWCREVKRLGELPPTNHAMMDLFDSFCEDFNTVTLPEKYYNLAAWEEKQRIKAAKKAAKRRAESGVDVSMDEKILADQRRMEKKRQEIHELHAKLVHVDREKAEAMREQDLLRRRIKFLYDTGEVEEARRLQEKLRAKGDGEREKPMPAEEDPYA